MFNYCLYSLLHSLVQYTSNLVEIHQGDVKENLSKNRVNIDHRTLAISRCEGGVNKNSVFQDLLPLNCK